MIELVNLSKRYKDFYAVKNMNMYIERGEIVGLLGPNGAGKSTAISMLSTLIEPTEGDVLFEKKSVLKNPNPLRQVTGVVPQEIALYDTLTAEENLYFFGRIYRLSKTMLKQKIEEVLDIIGLKERRKDVVKKFSGGMKRRLNIGVALLHDPELLIMDEPTVGIDPQSRNYILETVKRLNREKGMTILYTSHYMEEVEYLCDRIYIMDQGNVIAVGTKKEIKDLLTSEQSVQIETEMLNDRFILGLKEEPIIQELLIDEQTVTIIVPEETDIFQLVTRLADDANVRLKSVHIKSPTLEDVFLHLTGRALRD